VVIALTRVREISPKQRFAIVDTDAHHGDGTRQLIQDDPEVLHLCFCGANFTSPDGTKVDVDVYRLGWQAEVNKLYVDAVRRELPRLPQFAPDLLVWYYGFDTHADDYGSLGLTEPTFFEICDLMLFVSDELGIPLQVVLGGGSVSYLAHKTIPEIIRRLATD
jgi:acetoin utilization deacetylase AcuC-like enzyme